MNIKNISDIVHQQECHPIVFVSGVSGQDGSFMVDYLLRETTAAVIGGARRLSVENHLNIRHLEEESRFQLVNFDLNDSHSIYKLMEVAHPDYFINFAAQSFVASSWDFARQTWETNSTGVLDCLEAIRKVKPTCRFYNAGSSEEFGNVVYEPQDENHPPRPRSPYGASKSAARTLVKVYRESYGLYAVQGWLFNHEGTRRGVEFVTRKISTGVARIKKSLDYFKQIGFTWEGFDPIELGNLDAKRDWSDAEDMVDAVWRMLNQEQYDPDKNVKDYIAASGENHTIREFVEEAFRVSGIETMWENDKPRWVGKGLSEKYVMGKDDCICLVKINPKFYRPADVEVLCGDPTKIERELGWKRKTDFKTLVKKMVLNDIK